MGAFFASQQPPVRRLAEPALLGAYGRPEIVRCFPTRNVVVGHQGGRRRGIQGTGRRGRSRPLRRWRGTLAHRRWRGRSKRSSEIRHDGEPPVKAEARLIGVSAKLHDDSQLQPPDGAAGRAAGLHTLNPSRGACIISGSIERPGIMTDPRRARAIGRTRIYTRVEVISAARGNPPKRPLPRR